MRGFLVRGMEVMHIIPAPVSLAGMQVWKCRGMRTSEEQLVVGRETPRLPHTLGRITLP